MLDLKEKFFNFLKRFDPFFHQVNDFYSAYHVLVKMALVGAIVMSAIKYVEDQRSFSIDREIFDLNDVPCGKVVWIYPKDKSKSAVMPDSLKKELNVQEPGRQDGRSRLRDKVLQIERARQLRFEIITNLACRTCPWRSTVQGRTPGTGC